MTGCSSTADPITATAASSLDLPVGPLHNLVTTELTAAQRIALGEQLFFDVNLSANRNQSCASCHAPNWGFAGPDKAATREGGLIAHTFIPGSFRDRFGTRNVPTAAYASFTPTLRFEQGAAGDGPALENVWRGGAFWDGRASGFGALNPISEQALGPFVSRAEEAFPSLACVVYEVQRSKYYTTYFTSSSAPPLKFNGFDPTWCATEDREEINEWLDEGHFTRRPNISAAWTNIARFIGDYESSNKVNRFASAFDTRKMNREQQQGFVIFMGKGKCAACHVGEDNGQPAPPAEIFSDHSYYNLGLPTNRDTPGWTPAFRDEGLGAFLRDNWAAVRTATGLADVPPSHAAHYTNWYGAFKTATVRNVAKKASGASVKTYMHNGVLTSLEQVVDFYNTRDVRPCRGSVSPMILRSGLWSCWPTPEVNDAKNVIGRDIEPGLVGNLGLTAAEQKALVAFMTALSDK